MYDEVPVDGVEMLDPATTINGKLDIIKLNVGRQVDRINKAISEPGTTCQEDAIAYKKLSSSIKALDAMIRQKASKTYKFERVPLLEKMDKFEFELLKGREVNPWSHYLKPAMELYSNIFVELSQLGLVPYDEESDWLVEPNGGESNAVKESSESSE